MLSIIMLSVAFSYFYAECSYAECRYAKCRGAVKKIQCQNTLAIFLSLFQRRRLDLNPRHSVDEASVLPLCYHRYPPSPKILSMEQSALKNVNNCLYTNVYSYLETSGGISYNPYLNVAHFFSTRVN
jgi:hypothetical protein